MEYKNNRKEIHRKSIKNKNLGFLIEWSLKSRGKKDFKNQVVRKNINDQFTSPYIKKEISLCLVDVYKEKETLTKIIANYKAEIEEVQMQIERKNNQVNRINLNTKTPEPSNYVKIQSALNDDVIKSYRINEHNAKESTKNIQIENLNNFIETLLSKKQRYDLLIDKEIEITKLRCRQLYDILIAKLSTYWTGVLIAENNSNEIPPLFNDSGLLNEINSHLDKLDGLKNIEG